VLAFLPVCVLSQGGAPPEVGNLAAGANVIVVGTLSSGEESGGSQGTPTIEVERTVKGNVASGAVLPVSLPGDTPFCVSPRGVHAIWFLDSVAGGQYKLSPSVRAQLCDPADIAFE